MQTHPDVPRTTTEPLPRPARRARRRPRGWSIAAGLLAAVLAGQGVATAGTSPLQSGQAASPEGTDTTRLGMAQPAITGPGVLARARLWVDARPAVPYNQLHHFAGPADYYGDSAGHDPAAGWREDCSGFVSYAWGVAGPGYVTSTMSQIIRPIGWSSLQPGDALLLPGQHVALFAHWDDTAHTTYTLWDEANTTEGTKVTAGITRTNPYWSTYAPVRYNGLRPAAAIGDFTGRGRAAAAVWRPSNGTWYLFGSATVPYGSAGDIPVAADYTGDGVTDPAVWRPSSGAWFMRGRTTLSYGQAGDIPVPGDYTGDGVTDPALWRPSTGQWFFRGAAPTLTYGQAGDLPVPADYTGDGVTDLAVWRPSTGQWYLRGAAPTVTYGNPGDIPVPADYDGDGVTDLAVWRPTTGQWFFRSAAPMLTYGQAGDFPVSTLVLTRSVLRLHHLA